MLMPTSRMLYEKLHVCMNDLDTYMCIVVCCECVIVCSSKTVDIDANLSKHQ